MRQKILHFAYVSRLLGAYHRIRNRQALTVVGLHRVLPESDPRWAGADPLYTVTPGFLADCLDFFARHYSVVSLPQIEAAHANGTLLPPRPLLITFDDGWADNLEYALPVLRRHGLSFALFCASDAIDRREGFFQERLIAAWRSGRLTAQDMGSLWRACANADEIPQDVMSEAAVRRLTGRLQRLSPDRREQVLSAVDSQLHDPLRHMLTASELRQMVEAEVAIGVHGKRHEPLTEVADLDGELLESRRTLSRLCATNEEQVASLSFPFSRHDDRVVSRALQLGYRLLFGGGSSLTPVAAKVPALIARVGITAAGLADARGRLMPERLAAYLFRRPHAALPLPCAS
jgi:peptidoglycan/xylan/chitin deacetylase (PgdA/CDA1 family)